jgi:hypothetical protein
MWSISVCVYEEVYFQPSPAMTRHHVSQAQSEDYNGMKLVRNKEPSVVTPPHESSMVEQSEFSTDLISGSHYAR